MLFVRALPCQEEGELSRRLKRATKPRVYLRLKTGEVSHQGKPVQEIAPLGGRPPTSSRAYLPRFNEGGVEGVMPRWGGGASQKLKALDKAYFEDLLACPPRPFEKLRTPAQTWTYPLVQQELLEEGGEVSQSTIWYPLRRCKDTSGRRKLSVTSPDPAYPVKRERGEALEKKASTGA